jgi:hypothetical protein
MRKIQNRLISFSFFWISLWAIVGSLLGAKINHSLLHSNETYIQSLQRDLLRSAHAHMNLMAILVVLVALTLPKIVSQVSGSFAVKIAVALPLSVVVFGAGLVGEAFVPTTVNGISLFVVPTAIGGTIFLACTLMWAGMFWNSAK